MGKAGQSDLGSVSNVRFFIRAIGGGSVTTTSAGSVAPSSQRHAELSLPVEEVVGGSEGRVGEVDGGGVDEHAFQTRRARVVNHH